MWHTSATDTWWILYLASCFPSNNTQERYSTVSFNKSQAYVKKELYTKNPEFDAELEGFVAFSRSLGLPVTREFMRERALTTANVWCISSFKASNGYIEKFMRRAVVQSSVHLDGRDGYIIPNGHEERMNQIREVCYEYPLRNIYNMNESGLF